MKKQKIKFYWPEFKNNFIKKVDSSTILINGIFFTCIVLSIASGMIDITFFSGLSKSFLHFGTFPIAASILYTLISIGMISGKFWCAMRIGMLKELRGRLLSKGKDWAYNLNRSILPWNIAHKFLIIVSIITALSLSVNSIGSALKDAERNSTNITVSIDELKLLKDQRKSDNTDKRSLTRGNLEGIATSKQTAEAEADRYWPNIEKWQQRLKEIDESDKTEEEKLSIKNSERQSYMKRAPTFVNKNIDYISRTELVNRFQSEAKKSEVDKESIEAYSKLTSENDEEIKNTIIALENLYRHPDTYKDGLKIEGKHVSFLDEKGEPLDITQVIGKLQGLREEWKSNSDIGESSQIFMLVSEVITSKLGEGSSSGSGIAELMMMIFIAIAGIVQEFLIALFTPKATIDRRLLSQVSEYLRWENENEKERFLISVYKDYVGDGIISQNDFEIKCKQCVELMSQSEEDIIKKFSIKEETVEPVIEKPIEKPVEKKERKPRIKKEYSSAVDKSIQEIENLLEE